MTLGSVVRSKLRLMSVCDAENGVVLFERIWSWGEGGGIGNLVRSFFQIAKQLDHGIVSRVVFSSDSDRMQMLCTKNQTIVVALFYELTYDVDDDGVSAALRQFIEQSRELWDGPVPESKGLDDDFQSTVDVLLDRILHALDVHGG